MIERLQRRGTHYILPNTGLSYKEKLTKLNLLPLSYWHELNSIILFHKLINNQYNVQLNNLISFKNTRTTRHSSTYDIRVPLCRTKLFQNSYYCILPKIWNSLPEEIKLSPSINITKNKLKNYYNALTKIYNIDSPQTWNTVFPKCCRTNKLVSATPPCCCLLSFFCSVFLPVYYWCNNFDFHCNLFSFSFNEPHSSWSLH